MCGIFGNLRFDGQEIDRALLKRMGDVINHRGPDDQGIFYDSNVAIGNQRLSIIDVEGGNQPFFSEDRKISLVQNGEIYNYLELKEDLLKRNIKFKTNSDTEVLLKLYEFYGIDFIKKLNGMFAIAIYDKQKDCLILIRDRIGVKPLFYHKTNKEFIFSSEIKSILECNIKKEINIDALNNYLSFNYIPPPGTAFKDIYHLEPGSFMVINNNGQIRKSHWWSLADQEQENIPEKNVIEEFNFILSEAVKIRLRSDVDFGAFLSGGIDSSSVVGYMSKWLDQPVKTFCIGFNDPKYDESPYALEAATLFNTEHYSEKVNANMLDLWDKAIYHCDQPQGDISFLPTMKVSEIASKKVKMVLTGDGGDELFAGYEKYRDFFQEEEYLNNFKKFKSKYLDQISLFTNEAKQRLLKANLVDLNGPRELYESTLAEVKHWDNINKALFIDMKLLLPGNNLVKPDRMGMAHSLEARTPYLDFRMMEFAFKLNGKLKIRNNETKFIMKKSLEDLLGKKLTYRKKQMFTVPIGDWFQGELAKECNNYLNEINSNEILSNYFHQDEISRIFLNHIQKKENNTREIRSIIAIHKWTKIFKL